MKKFLPFVLLALMILVSNVLVAQPGGVPTGPGCWPPPCIPIDGGIGLLLAAGAALGGKKLLDIRKTT